jgi:hypothetical protein
MDVASGCGSRSFPSSTLDTLIGTALDTAFGRARSGDFSTSFSASLSTAFSRAPKVCFCVVFHRDFDASSSTPFNFSALIATPFSRTHSTRFRTSIRTATLTSTVANTRPVRSGFLRTSKQCSCPSCRRGMFCRLLGCCVRWQPN